MQASYDHLVAANCPPHAAAALGGVDWAKLFTLALKVGRQLWPIVEQVVAANPNLKGNALIQAIETAVNAWLAAHPQSA